MGEEPDHLVRARDNTHAREGVPHRKSLSPEAEERRREYQRAYNRARRKTPKEKATRREYQRRPEVRERKREHDRLYRQRPEVKLRERQRKERIKEAEKARHLFADYGIGIEVWNRMWRDQGGLCAICGRAAATHVDHDHQTGRVRALVCSPCNTAIGRFRDDPTLLRAAADYLEHHAVKEAPYVQERLFDA